MELLADKLQSRTSESPKFRSTGVRGKLPSKTNDVAFTDDEDEVILPSPCSRFGNDETFEQSLPSSENTTDGDDSLQPPKMGEVIEVRHSPPHMRKLRLLQHWEGEVKDLDGFCVHAVITDLTNRSMPAETVEMDLDEFPKVDQPLLRPGAIFYWSIGEETRSGAQVLRVSEIRMKRMAPWTKRQIDALNARGNALYELFNNNPDNATTTG